MAYNPESLADRCALAVELNAMLVGARFEKLKGSSIHEDVYQFPMPYPGAYILVYSSIVGGAVRGDGEDAIRVAAIYRTKAGQERGLFKDTRINRTGEINKIVTRTKDRMRNAYVVARDRFKSGMFCNHCGAPLFTSKSGKDVCAEICWEKK